jgi:hypothetical protein
MAGLKSANSPELLKKLMQDHVRQIDPSIDETTMFSYAFVDLNGDGKDEAIVYLTGRSWCGTGGCNTYVLTRDGGKLQVRGQSSCNPNADTGIRQNEPWLAQHYYGR